MAVVAGTWTLLVPFWRGTNLKDYRLMGRQDLGLELASVRARTWKRLRQSIGEDIEQLSIPQSAWNSRNFS